MACPALCWPLLRPTFRPGTARRLAQPNLITEENRKPGSLDWQLTRVRLDKMSSFRSRWIEGYCSHQSVQAGDELRIMVSTAPAARFQIEIFRTGYYGGRGARLLTTLGPFQGKPQPVPDVGPRRLRECKWEPSATLKIPADWPSGVYLGRLTTLPEKDTEPYWQSYVVFIVRDNRPGRHPAAMQRQHLAGLQPLAGRLFAVHQPQGHAGALERRQLRPPLRQVRPDL